jgi:hypothetical protein
MSTELIERLEALGPWAAHEDSRLIETASVVVIVERIGTGSGTATVLISVRGAETPGPADLVITDGAGHQHQGERTRRGQLRFDDVSLDGFTFSRPIANVVPLRSFVRIERVLAHAAASGTRVIAGSFDSTDGTLVTRIEENEEGRLIVNVSASGSWSAEQLAQLRWSAITSDGVAMVRSLITPLAKSLGSGFAARYDLGSVLGADAIEVQPAEPTTTGVLTVESVRETFSCLLFGSAVRAWEQLASVVTDIEVRAAITEGLHQ